MLNVGALREGYVLDHIKAGKAMTIYHDLKLDKLDCTVAIIKNARSNKMGKKDIIKVEALSRSLTLIFLVLLTTILQLISLRMRRLSRKKSFVFQSR